MTTKGWREDDFKDLAYIIDGYLKRFKDEELSEEQFIGYIEMIGNLVSRER